MNKIAEYLNNVSSVAIAGHVRPDGDCIGSCMGMYQYIRNNFKHIKVDVYLQKIPNVFRFIEGTEDIISNDAAEQQYDLFLALDCADLERLGEAQKIFQTARQKICIDHHISNPGYGDINHIEPAASSTSELVFELLEEEKITKKIAEALYTGLVHDTGVFHYTCTSAKTMNIAGKLMDKGIDYTNIVDDTFYKKTYLQNQILGRALMKSILYLDGKCIVSTFDRQEMDLYQIKTGDFEGVVSQLRVTEGVEAAIFIHETSSGDYRVSMRSNGKVDVSRVAGHFNGGGHKMAAGCTMEGPMETAVDLLTAQIQLQIK